MERRLRLRSVRPDWNLRNRAAIGHLAALFGITSLWLPLVLGRSANEDSEFLDLHSRGAAYFQALGLTMLVALWFSKGLPSLWFTAVSAGFVMALWGVISFCLVGLYALGAVALALQAWNGDTFWAPIVSLWVKPAWFDPEDVSEPSEV